MIRTESSGLNPRLQQLLMGCGVMVMFYFMVTISQLSTTSLVPATSSINISQQIIRTRSWQTHDNVSMIPLALYRPDFEQTFSNGITNTHVSNTGCNCSCSCCNNTKSESASVSDSQIPPEQNEKPEASKKPDKLPPKEPAKKPKVKAPITIPSHIKKQLGQITIVGSLKDYSIELFEKAKAAIKMIQTTVTTHKVAAKEKASYIAKNSLGISKFVFNSNLTICNPQTFKETKMILFTTMFHADSKQYLFNNTLTNYALLQPIIQPLLYISDMKIIEFSGYLIHRACALGWTVAAAPRSTAFGFPILNSMFYHALNLFPTTHWVGYANADILFTYRLPSVLKFVHSTPSMANFSFMSSRRTNVYLPPGKQLHSLEEAALLTKAKTAKVHTPMAIDLFFYRRDSPLFRSMPDFCIGRRGYDNWLIFYQKFHNISSLELTESSPAVHIGVQGVSFKANSHQAQKAENDYNVYIAEGQNWGTAGLTTCLSHFLKFKKDNTTTPSSTALEMRGHFQAEVPKKDPCSCYWDKGKLVAKKKQKKPKKPTP